METTQQKIARLEVELEKLKGGQPRTQDELLAELLHEKLCLRDHTEHRDWNYGNFAKLSMAHKDYLEMANRILKVVDYGSAVKVVKAI